jgi:hypothetical protein
VAGAERADGWRQRRQMMVELTRLSRTPVCRLASRPTRWTDMLVWIRSHLRIPYSPPSAGLDCLLLQFTCFRRTKATAVAKRRPLIRAQNRLWPRGPRHLWGLTSRLHVRVNPWLFVFGLRAASFRLNRGHLRFDAAITRTAIDAAVTRMMLAKAELKRLERKPTQGSGTATQASPVQL